MYKKEELNVSNQKVVDYYNHIQGKNMRVIPLKLAKGKNIFAERTELEEKFGKEKVTEVFGKPGQLEEAEKMFSMLEYCRNWASLERTLEYLVNITYRLSNCCSQEGKEYSNLSKYTNLPTNIPVDLINFKDREVKHSQQVMRHYYITTQELISLKNDLLQNDKYMNPLQKAYATYLSEEVYLSLKEIFMEIKKTLNS